MKKAPAIFLLLLIIYQLLGYYSIHQLQIYHIKKEVKKRIKKSIPNDELIKFTFALSETNKIQWVKKGKEFIFEKLMYDVVEAKIVADSINYLCIADFKETQLYAQLDSYVNNFLTTHPNKNKKAAQLIKKISLEYFVKKNGFSTLYITSKKWMNYFLSCTTYVVFQRTESPPPKFS